MMTGEDGLGRERRNGSRGETRARNGTLAERKCRAKRGEESWHREGVVAKKSVGKGQLERRRMGKKVGAKRIRS